MSLSKNKIKYIQSLKHKKYRSQHNTFVAEGAKLILDLMPHLACQLLVVAEEIKDDIPNIEAEETIITTRHEIKKASHLATPPDAIAVFYQSQQDLSHIDFTHKLTLMLDGVQENIICSLDTVDVYNTKTVQATMGALSRVNIHYASIPQLITQYSNLPVYGTFLNGENIYTETLKSEGFIVMGNEGKGIRAEIEKLITHRLYIPSFSNNSATSESLNVAVATAVVCSEFRRR